MTVEEINKKIQERGISVEEAPNLIKRAKELRMPSEVITQIITVTGNREFMRKCAEDPDTPILSIDRVKIIKLVRDEEFTLNMLFGRRGTFMTREKAELIKSLADIDSIIVCLNARELQIDSHVRANIVIEKNDLELIKRCLKTPQLMYPQDVKRVLQSIKDKSILRSFLDDVAMSDHKVAIIEVIGDKELAKECVKTKGLISYQQKAVIEYINDPEFTRACLKDKEINLNQEQKVELIQAIETPSFIRECLKDDEIGLESSSKVKLIKTTRDEKTIQEYMTNPELGLAKQERLVLALEYGNDDLVQQLIAENKQEAKRIKIPEGMTVGVEIEAANLEVNPNLFKRWKAKEEESVENGAEYTSPILTGSENDSHQIYFVCNVLRTMGAQINEKCGGHIHIGDKFLTTAQSYINLLELWCNTEEILFAISNKAGEITRVGAVEKHAVPLSGKVESALKKQQIYVDDRTREWDLLMGIIDIQKDRYSSINFKNYTHRIKETIEFRLSNGTLDPDVWIENINLFAGIMNAAEKLRRIKEKAIRTPEERAYAQQFQKIKNPTATQEEKLEGLLELTIPEEDRDIYRERYHTNMAMLEENGIILSEIREKEAKHPIDIGKIGQSLYTGENAVPARKIVEAESRLERDTVREIPEKELEI
ncbi:MAG: amidoligase family protein [Clostridium sp.]|nr:amidoligase family protein [Clostridium sp.]